MIQKTSTIDQVMVSSKKCPKCGLRNFADQAHCQRCKSDLSLPMAVAKQDKNMFSDSGELERSGFRFAWIVVVLVVVLLGVVFLNWNRGPQPPPEVASAAVMDQPAPAAVAEPQVQTPEEENAQSEEAATEIVTNLKRFQDAAESGVEFSEYDKNLRSLKVELNNTLPSFVRHNPNADTFRQEVNAALLEYTAARDWWKTTIVNSSVFTEADRDERTQKSWASARIHLTNAEKALGR